MLQTQIENLRWLLAALVFVHAGCFEIEQSIKLRKNLSGTATLKMTIDFEPMVEIMAAMQASVSGKGGAPSKADLTRAKRDFAKKQKADLEAKRNEVALKVADAMPEGVKLLKYKAKLKGAKLVHDMAMSFQNIAFLGGVDLKEVNDKPDENKNPLDSPYAGLKVSEKDGIVTLELGLANPTEAILKMSRMKKGGGAAEAPAPNDAATDDRAATAEGGVDRADGTADAKADAEKPETADAGSKDAAAAESASDPPGNNPLDNPDVKKLLEKMKVKFSLKLPSKPIEHNATGMRGKRLTWEYDYAALVEMNQAGQSPSVRVTFKK